MTITLKLLNERFHNCSVCNNFSNNYIISFLGITFYSCDLCYNKILDEIIPKYEYNLQKFSRVNINEKYKNTETHNYPQILVGTSSFLAFDKKTQDWKVPLNNGSCNGLEYCNLRRLSGKVNFVPLIEIDIKHYDKVFSKEEIECLLRLNKNLLYGCILSNWRLRNILHGILYENNCIFSKYIPIEIFCYIYSNFF